MSTSPSQLTPPPFSPTSFARYPPASRLLRLSHYLHSGVHPPLSPPSGLAVSPNPAALTASLTAALTLATATCLETLDTDLYATLTDPDNPTLPPALAAAILNDPTPRDTTWITTANTTYTTTLKTHESSLATSKTNLLKDGIRTGYLLLADLYTSRGLHTLTLKSLLRSRDYCTSNAHNTNLCVKVLTTSLLLKNYSHVASYLAKANYSHDQDPVTTAKLTVTRGLLCLHEASSANSPPLASLSYSLAADHFTTVDIVIGMEYADIVTTEDIALYGVLTALASWPTSKVKTLQKPPFLPFLSLVPTLTSLVSSYVRSDFATTLSHLQTLAPTVCACLFLGQHHAHLFTMITDKCLTSYLRPYERISVGKIAGVFGGGVDGMRDRLVGLIEKGELKDRKIDSELDLLVHAPVSLSSTASLLLSVAAAGDLFCDETSVALLTMSLKDNGVVRGGGRRVKNHNRGGRGRRKMGNSQGGGGASSGFEDDFEDMSGSDEEMGGGFDEDFDMGGIVEGELNMM